ncbi:MAG: DUF1080 domain-containing protein [Planctomycetia bacterium]|nr:DUF1080 domain-containing protein [Planctomycetia bacterium]
MRRFARTLLILGCTLALLAISPAPAQQAKGEKEKDRQRKLFDPQHAGPEAMLQGEYEGKRGVEKFGAQLVARGERQFHILLFPGGLPGDGWDGKDYVFMEGGTLKDQRIEFKSSADSGDGAQATVADGKITGTLKAGDPFVLQRIERCSPTLGAKPPAQAVVLFDGRDTAAWQDKAPTIEPAALPIMDEHGRLLAGAVSKRSFRDFTLHLEFYLGFEPEGLPWRRADSGVYLMERYEIAVGDTCGFDFDIVGTAGRVPPTVFTDKQLKGEKFGLFMGKKNPHPAYCGTLFRANRPAPNYCFAPLTWQTLDIEFQAPRFDATGKKQQPATVSAKLNGLPVVERQTVNGPTAHGAKGEVPEAPLWLQGYQRTVLYRNIWLVEKNVAAAP